MRGGGVDHRPLLRGSESGNQSGGVSPMATTAPARREDGDHSDTHIPTHKKLGSIVCKYKYYLLVMLACIIITVSCGIAIPANYTDPDNTLGLSWESYYTINCVMGTILLMLLGLPPDLILVAVNVVLTLTPCSRSECIPKGSSCDKGVWGACTIIGNTQAWKGFASTSVLSIGALFMVAKGVEKTGIISYMAQFVLGSPRRLWVAILRMCLPVAIISAFINDTPVVAVMMPIIEAWALKTGTAVSKLMIPLSYAALLGGMCTLTGTSTNLVLAGLLNSTSGSDGITLTMFEMTPVGACVALSCIVYMSACAKCLLPNRKANDGASDNDAKDLIDDDAEIAASGKDNRSPLASFASTGPIHAKTFVVDVTVRPKSKLVGKQIGDTLLCRNGNELLHLSSADGVFDGVAPVDHEIVGGDIVVLACPLKELLKLRYDRDVTFRRQQQITQTLKAGRRHRKLFEVVVAPGNPLIGSYVRDSFIMSLHPAEILAVRYSGTFAMRHGDDVTQSHQIEAYDTMLVESYPSFEKAFKTGSAFLSVTPIESSTPPRNYTKVDTSRMLVSGLIVILMIVGIVGYSDFIFEWAIVAAFLLIWTQCLTVSEAFKAVKGRVILGILAAMGLGGALQNTGVALAAATGMAQLGLMLHSPILLLSLIYYTVALLSCVAGNQATVIILFPIVREVVGQLNNELTLTQFVIVLIMGASSSFMSPYSYQTNLMVWEAGKYRFSDYPKFGAGMTVLAGIVTGITTYYIIPLTAPETNATAVAV